MLSLCPEQDQQIPALFIASEIPITRDVQDLPEGILLRGWARCQRSSLPREPGSTVPQTCALSQTQLHLDTALLALWPLWGPHTDVSQRYHTRLGHRAGRQHLARQRRGRGHPIPFPKSRLPAWVRSRQVCG